MFKRELIILQPAHVRCVYCGRCFISEMSHRCKGGYRKNKLKFIKISQIEYLKDATR